MRWPPLPLLALALVLACVDKGPGPDPDDTSPPDSGPLEDCEDGVDNDADGAADCQDPDCVAHVSCGEDCEDGADNDADGAADCYDTDCTGTSVCLEDCASGLDEDVDGATDCDDTDCTAQPQCAPTLEGLSPAWGWTDRPTVVVLSGAGLAWDSAGTTTLTVGGVPATAVAVIDANTVSATFPALGAEGSVDVVLSNNNGSATLEGAFSTVLPAIYAADGKQGTPGKLYRYDPEAGALDTLGTLSYGLTGLAFNPSRDLYGVTSTQSGTLGSARLVRVAPATGSVTALSTLVEGGGHHNAVADITFVGERLLGWTEATDEPIEIALGTGVVTRIGGGTGSSGSGLAYDPTTATLYVAPEGATGDLYTVNTTTGATKRACTLNHKDARSINSMTLHDGVLYAILADYGGSPPSDLYALDPTSCGLFFVVALSAGVDAIASNRP